MYSKYVRALQRENIMMKKHRRNPSLSSPFSLNLSFYYFSIWFSLLYFIIISILDMVSSYSGNLFSIATDEQIYTLSDSLRQRESRPRIWHMN